MQQASKFNDEGITIKGSPPFTMDGGAGTGGGSGGSSNITPSARSFSSRNVFTYVTHSVHSGPLVNAAFPPVTGEHCGGGWGERTSWIWNANKNLASVNLPSLLFREYILAGTLATELQAIALFRPLPHAPVNFLFTQRNLAIARYFRWYLDNHIPPMTFERLFRSGSAGSCCWLRFRRGQ